MGDGLVERDGELARIEALLERARSGEGGALLLEGPPGIGKSTLVAQARERAGELRVLSATAAELEQSFAFGVVRQMLERPVHGAGEEDRTRWLAGPAAPAASLLGLADGTRPADETGLVHALYWLVTQMADERPVALLLDDLHWCDAGSLRWAIYLAHRLDGLPVALLAATRPTDPLAHQALLRALASEPAVELVALRPLSARGVTALVARRLGDPETPFAQAAHELCGGNPLVLDALLAAASDASLTPDRAGVEALRDLAPHAVERWVQRSLDRIGDDAVRTARALAILGDGTGIALVARLADLDPDRGADAAVALADADVLVRGDELRFAHPLLRAAVLATVPIPHRERLHAQAARLLDDSRAPAEQVAAQLIACEPSGAAWAIDALVAAAQDARDRGAPATAATLLRRAIEERPPPERRPQLQLALGSALLTAGDAAGVEPLLEARTALTDPEVRCAAAFRAGTPLSMLGAVDQLEAVTAEALDEAARHAPHWVFPLAVGRVMTTFGSSSPVAAGALSAAIAAGTAEGAQPGSVPWRAAAGLLSLAIVTLTTMPVSSARTWAERAIGEPGALEASVDQGFPLPGAVLVLALTDGPVPSEPLWEVCVAGVRRRGALGIGLGVVAASRAMARVVTGDLVGAEQDARIAAEVTAPAFSRVAVLGWAARAHALTELGDAAGALAVVERPTQECWQGAQGVVLRLARSRALLASRLPEEAFAEAMRAREQLRVLGGESPTLQPWRSHAARALLALGRAPEAAELASAELELARRCEAPSAIGVAQVALALAHGDVDGLETAERTLAGSHARVEHARALIELGAALRRRGDRAASREPLAAGMDLAHRCSAVPLERRAHEELLAAGSRPRRVLRTGPDALSPSELRVARLAAGGLTNRQIAQELFVTPKTVESQLRAAFRKLDVRARGELAAALEP